MNLPNHELMNKVYWLNRYFDRVEKLFDSIHNKWLNEAIQNYGSERFIELVTNLKKRTVK